MNNQQIFLKKDSNETVNLDTLIVNQSLQQKEFEKLVYQNYVKPNQFNVDQTLQNTDQFNSKQSINIQNATFAPDTVQRAQSQTIDN